MPPSPLLGRAGAVAGTGVDAGVAVHYGDPLAEQRLLLRGETALVDRSHRGVIAVAGEDRLSWLHSLTSQHLSELPVGEPREALVLSPHGHVEEHLVISDDGQRCWIDVEPGQTAALVAYLDSMRFMLRVDVADVSADVALLTVVSAPGGASDPAGVLVARGPLSWGRDLLVSRELLAPVVDDLGLPVVGHDAFEALRVAARRPRLGFETDHRTIPHEIGWIGSAVHLDKGCYRGQETVARVHNLGRPPRRLVLVHLDGSREQLPAPGSPVELDGRAVGFFGTSSWHAELGQIGLAVIKRQIPDDAHLLVSGVAAAIDPTS